MIGRITPVGVITEFPIPTADSKPVGIASGPDSNLWFTESALASNKIGRITTTGSITEFPIPTAGSGPWAITSGLDGNLWFMENVGNKIGRITTAGVVTEFPIPTAGSQPLGIASGSDGNLWFTETAVAGNKIGRLSLGLSFFTLTPCRVLDTRNAAGPDAGAPALAAGETRTVAAAGKCDIPPTAAAISVNMTVTSPAAPGYVTLYPADGTLPLASMIDFSLGQTRANNAILALAFDGSGFKALNGSAGNVHFILDVNGYFR